MIKNDGKITVKFFKGGRCDVEGVSLPKKCLRRVAFMYLSKKYFVTTTKFTRDAGFGYSTREYRITSLGKRQVEESGCYLWRNHNIDEKGKVDSSVFDCKMELGNVTQSEIRDFIYQHIDPKYRYIYDVRIPLPPGKEQLEIDEFLERKF